MTSYAELIQAVFDECNQLRTDPKLFSERLEFEFLSTYKSANARHRSGSVPVITREGVKAVHEAIEHLKSIHPLEALTWCDGLTRAAQSHVNDTGPLGIIGHTGSLENTLGERLSLFGKWSDCIGEVLDYSSIDPFEVVVSYIIDDGLPTRPHRNLLLNPRFKKIGVGAGPHSEYKTVVCVVFAGGFVEKEGMENIEVPHGGIQTFPETENWLDGAIRMTCETRTESENGETIKRIKKYWEMTDGSTKVTEEILRPTKESGESSSSDLL